MIYTRLGKLAVPFSGSNRRKALLKVLLLFLMALPVQGLAQKNAFYHNQNYLEFGVGGSLYNNPHISQAQNNRPAIIGFVEAGRLMNRLALNASFSFFETYRLNNFRYKPKYINLLAKPYLLSTDVNNLRVDVYGLLGLHMFFTSLIDEDNTNVVTYENKEEKDRSVGMSFGIGGQLAYRQWVFHVQWLHINSKSNFIGGSFEEREFRTGADQIQLLFGYRLRKAVEGKKKNGKLCSTYL